MLIKINPITSYFIIYLNLWWTFRESQNENNSEHEDHSMYSIHSIYFIQQIFTEHPPCACPMLGSWYRGVVQMSITGKQTLRRRLDLWQAKRLDLLIHWPVTECSSPWEGGVTLDKGASSFLEAGWARPSVLEGDPMSTESIQSLPSENVNIISQHILYTSFLVLLIWIYNSF